MVTPRIGFYVYHRFDAYGGVRYVGKGTGRRVDTHLGIVESLAAGAPPLRASKVNWRFAEEVRAGRKMRSLIVVDGLDQAAACELETKLVIEHRRETEGATLWNVLAGGDGFQGILHDDWVVVARRSVATKELSGSGRLTWGKAATTEALTGSGLRVGAKAAATRLRQLTP